MSPRTPRSTGGSGRWLCAALLSLPLGNPALASEPPPAAVAITNKQTQTVQQPSRALLDFLAEFAELDDTEFEMLTAYAKKDANAETQDASDD